MKLPKQLRIGPFHYRLVKSPAEKMGKYLGDTNHNTLRIKIASKQPKSKEREIALHEATHGCLFAAGADQEALMDVEKWMDCAIPALLQMLRENPDFVKYLMEPEKK